MSKVFAFCAWFACLAIVHAIESKVCEFDLVWYDNASLPLVYRARSEITEGLENTDKVELNTTVDVLHYLDLEFIPELKVLTLDRLGIMEIKPGAFKNLPRSLENLTITNNEFYVIPELLFNNLAVVHLNLSGNQIRTVEPGAFDNMTNLSTIVLDNNGIQKYEIRLANCPKLHLISFRHNDLAELDEGIFTAIKDNILTLDMSHNNIKKIHKLAFDVKEFKEVFLNDNALENAMVLIKLVKADKVDLSNNKVQCLPKEFMENGLSKIKLLNLSGNPLNCSCLHDLRKKVRKNIEFQKMSPLVKNIHITLPEKECDN
ncbi:keratocan-like [Rhynchophorus ferrugineus]|uniref:keratocan-like n=1 Tax=Rhynchophorus ferrugineus TaxID=354439 RepID=UPI003FCD3AC2